MQLRSLKEKRQVARGDLVILYTWNKRPEPCEDQQAIIEAEEKSNMTTFPLIYSPPIERLLSYKCVLLSRQNGRCQ